VDASVLGPRRRQVESWKMLRTRASTVFGAMTRAAAIPRSGPALGDLSEDLALARREYFEAIGGLRLLPDTGSSGRARGHTMGGARLSRRAPCGR
jgi:hypothetical protein